MGREGKQVWPLRGLGRESGPGVPGWQRLPLSQIPCSPLTLAWHSGPTLSCLFGWKPLQKWILKHTQAEMSVTDTEP